MYLNAENISGIFARFLLILPLKIVVYAAEIDLNFTDKNEIIEGEKHFAELVKKSQSYGDCWKEAISELHVGCKQLTEEVQSRLALSFANCFLQQAGSKPCPCAPDVPISNCLKNASDRVFSTYTEFFTHTQSICHYLQHKEWQLEAARTALELTENSKHVSKKLDESSRSQSKILDLQKVSLTEQKRLISNSRVLNAELQKSRERAMDIYNQFKTTTQEQKLLLFEVFDRMKNLQNFVLGEFTGVYTVAYYVVALTLSYVLTSVPRTSEARISLILLITLNAISEKVLTSYTLQENMLDVNPLSTSGLLHDRIWLSRKIACLIGLIIFMVTYYRYKDYNAINNELLREIQQQNKDLQSFIRGLTLNENFQNLATELRNSTEQSSVGFQPAENGKITISTATGKTKTQHNTKSLTELKSTLEKFEKDSENKENCLSVIPAIDSTIQLKVTPKTKASSQKKARLVKSPGTRLGKSSQKENILTQLEFSSPPVMNSPVQMEFTSPGSTRYNLRSSSRFNSPQLSP